MPLLFWKLIDWIIKIFLLILLLILGVTAVIVFYMVCNYITAGIMWDKQGKILQNDSPSGRGELLVKGQDVIFMKITRAPTKFKPITAEEIVAGKPLESTEPWMDDTSERLSRVSVRILRGTIEADVQEIFKQFGQTGAWWVSPDWQTIYVTTEWVNFVNPSFDNAGNTLRHNELWKTEDGGQKWVKLPWPALTDPGIPHFRSDGHLGYLIGQGPRLWRTKNGGDDWQEIKIPTKSKSTPNTRKPIPVFDLDEFGTLYFSFYNKRSNSSYIYLVPWADMPDDLNLKTDYIEVPERKIISMHRYGDNSFYILSHKVLPPRASEDPKRSPTGVLSRLDGGQLTDLYTFDDPALTVTVLKAGRNGLLMVWGSYAGKPVSKPVAMVSRDEGQNWKELKVDHFFAGGYYFDQDNNELWRYLLSGSLDKMKL